MRNDFLISRIVSFFSPLPAAFLRYISVLEAYLWPFISFTDIAKDVPTFANSRIPSRSFIIRSVYSFSHYRALPGASPWIIVRSPRSKFNLWWVYFSDPSLIALSILFFAVLTTDP